MTATDIIAFAALIVSLLVAAFQYWPVFFPPSLSIVVDTHMLLRPPEHNAQAITELVLIDDVRKGHTAVGRTLATAIHRSNNGTLPVVDDHLRQAIQAQLVSITPSLTYEIPLDLLSPIKGQQIAAVPVVISTSFLNKAPQPAVVTDAILELRGASRHIIYAPIGFIDMSIFMRQGAQYRDFMKTFVPIYVAPNSVEHRNILFARVYSFDALGTASEQELIDGEYEAVFSFTARNKKQVVKLTNIIVTPQQILDILKGGSLVNNNSALLIEAKRGDGDARGRT